MITKTHTDSHTNENKYVLRILQGVGVLFAILNSNACSLVRHLHVEINIELKHITAEPSAVCSALYLFSLSCVIYYSDQRGECHNQYNEIEKSMVRAAQGGWGGGV